MRPARSLAAVLVLAICAGVAGTHADGARQDARSPNDGTQVLTDAQRIGIGSRVRVDLASGRRMKGVLVAIEDQALRVAVRQDGDVNVLSLPLAEVGRIRKEGKGSAARWVAIGIALGVLIPVGVCAAAAS
jgi:hypothetical protein